jgi:hypothetical protein
MKHQKRLRYGSWVLLALYYGGLVCMLSALFLRSMTSCYVGVGIMALSVILADVLLRCPTCRKPLLKYKMHSIPRFCSNCGEQLREE